ncbi:hypothetical protein D7X25_29470 [bacterium 1XD42-8]|nr:hypothetical protein D7X25_29470 [bacterium 1XD42-8]
MPPLKTSVVLKGKDFIVFEYADGIVFYPYGKDKDCSMPVMKYMAVNKIPGSFARKADMA